MTRHMHQVISLEAKKMLRLSRNMTKKDARGKSHLNLATFLVVYETLRSILELMLS
jgi:hypothetical protein